MALLAYVASFADELTGPHGTAAQLADGVALYELLSVMAPTHFEGDAKEFETPALRVADILDSLSSFFSEEVLEDEEGDAPLNLGALVDVGAFCRGAEGAVSAMLELVVLCCVNSARKEEAIQNIMGKLSEEQQGTLMTVITEGTEKLEGTRGAADIGDVVLAEQPDAAAAASASASAPAAAEQKVAPGSPAHAAASQAMLSELQLDNEILSGKVEVLQRENRELQRRMDAARTQFEQQLQQATAAAQSKGPSADSSRELEEVRTRLRVNKEKSERRVRDLSAEIDTLQAQLSDLTDRSQAAQQEFKQRLRAAEDEADLLRDTAKKLAVVEAERDGLRVRLKHAESEKKPAAAADDKSAAEQSEKLVERVAELEAEARVIPALREQLAGKKEQLLSSQKRCTQLLAAAAAAEEQVTNLQQQLRAETETRKFAQKQVKAAEVEVESLRTQLDIQGDKPSSPVAAAKHASSGGAGGGGSANSEEIAALKLENARLRAAAKSGNDLVSSLQLEELRDECEMHKKLAADSQDRFLDAQKRIRALEVNVEKLKAGDGTAVVEDESTNELVARLKKDAAFLKSALQSERRSRAELEKRVEADRQTASENKQAELIRMAVEQATSAATANAKKAISESEVHGKLVEAQSQVEKLKEYVTAAKTKLKDNEERLTKALSQGVAYGEALKTLRRQLKEKEIELAEREKIRLETKKVTKREQRLVSAAFYDLGMQFQSALLSGKAVHGAQDRDGGRGKGDKKRSWMAQQRALFYS